MIFINFLSYIFDFLNKKAGLKYVPINRSSYNFAKLNANFIGSNIKKLDMKYDSIDNIISKIKNNLEKNAKNIL